MKFLIQYYSIIQYYSLFSIILRIESLRIVFFLQNIGELLLNILSYPELYSQFKALKMLFYQNALMKKSEQYCNNLFMVCNIYLVTQASPNV